MAESDRPIHVDIDAQGTARLTLSRPEVRNAFDAATIAALLAALRDLARQRVRILVLAGDGKALSAGADINWMRAQADNDWVANRADAEELAQLLFTVDAFPAPTIARVHGACVGGAVGLVAACDVAVGTTDATFGLREVRLGIAPAVIGPYVTRAIGTHACRHLMLTGSLFNGVEAHRLGLLSQVVPPDGLDDAIAAVIKELQAGGPEAQRRIKSMLHTLADLPRDPLISYTADLIAHLRSTPEGREGLASFLEKRPANWTQ